MLKFLFSDEVGLESRSEELVVLLLSLDDLLQNLVNLLIGVIVLSIRINLYHEIGVGGLVSKLGDPLLKARASLVEGNPPIEEASSALTLLIDGLNLLAKRRLLNTWWFVLNVVSVASGHINSPAQSSSEALISLTVEPNHGIKARWDQSLRRLGLGSWLHQQTGLFLLLLSNSWLQISWDDVA